MKNLSARAAFLLASEELLSSPSAQVFGGDRPGGRHPKDGFDLNCGLCEEWANRVAELLPGAKVVDSFEHGHMFVRLAGRYYDAECFDGVDDWRNLPMVLRATARNSLRP